MNKSTSHLPNVEDKDKEITGDTKRKKLICSYCFLAVHPVAILSVPSLFQCYLKSSLALTLGPKLNICRQIYCTHPPYNNNQFLSVRQNFNSDFSVSPPPAIFTKFCVLKAETHATLLRRKNPTKRQIYDCRVTAWQIALCLKM